MEPDARQYFGTWHDCEGGVVKPYPTTLCSNCHGGAAANFDVREAVSALRSRVEELEAALRRALSVVEDAAIERMREDGYAPHESEEPCTCYDEVDGAPDGPPPGRCLCCRIRAALSPSPPEE
jgi:hypothetical protein